MFNTPYTQDNTQNAGWQDYPNNNGGGDDFNFVADPLPQQEDIFVQ